MGVKVSRGEAVGIDLRPAGSAGVASRLHSRFAGLRIPLAWLQVGVFFLFLGALPLAKAVDPDFWWHLKTGEIIFESGVPTTDPFSWTANSRAWTAHEWLSELILYVTTRSLGYGGAVFLCGAATIAALTLMYAQGRREGSGYRLLLLLALLSTVMLLRFVTVRPQVFTWLLFSLFVYILAQDDDRGGAPLYVLPPLMALWANLHLGFVYGLTVVAAWVASRLVRRTQDNTVDVRKPLAVGLLCIAATLINPSGVDLLLYPLRYIEDSSSTAIVYEWQRPNFLNPFMAPYLIGVVVLALSLLPKERPSLFFVLVTVLVLGLSLQAIRNLPFAALLLAPVTGGVAARRWQSLNRRSDNVTTMRASIAVPLLGTFVAVFALTLSQGSGLSLQAPTSRYYPQEGADYVKAHFAERRMYNEYTWGGYLIYRLYPAVPVFIDGRTDFYRSGILDDYTTIGKLEPGWQDVIDEYGIDVMLLRTESRLAKQLHLEREWQAVFSGEHETVFTRLDAEGPR